MRQTEIAALCGVSVEFVIEVSAEEVRAALTGGIDPVVLDVATQEGQFAKCGTEYFLDDPYFGDVVNIRDLAYNSKIGLHKNQ